MSDKLNENSVENTENTEEIKAEALEETVVEEAEETVLVEEAEEADLPEINAESPKLEENDNWEFDGKALTLDDTFIENDEMIIEIPKREKKEEKETLETRERPKKTEAAEAKETSQKSAVDSRNTTLFLLVAILGVIIVGALTFLGIRYYTVPATIGASETHEVTNPGNVALTIKGSEKATKVTAGLYSYYYNQIVTSYASQAQQGYVENFDVTKDFSKQKTKDDDGKEITWQKKMDDETVKWLQQLVAYYSKGVDDGIKLTDDEKDTIEEEIKTVKQNAKDADLELDEYVTATYGDYVTVATLRKANEMYIIAQNYARKMSTELRPSIKEAQKYYKKHEDDFLQVNFAYLPMIYQQDNKDKVVKQAKKYADKVKTIEDMKKIVPKACKDLIDQYVESGQFSDSEAVVEQIAGSLETSTSKSNPSQYPDELIKFLFDDNKKPGTCTVITDDQYQAVYVILKQSNPSPAKDEKYSVRHILISPTEDESEKEEEEGDDHSHDDENKEATEEQWKAAQKKADNIYKEYLQSEKTEYKFALLAEEYSSDPGSISSGGQGAFGGLYYKQAPGTMVKEFEDWILDKNRRYGDTDIVKTKYGYHIMYFVDKQPDYIMDCLTAVSMEMEDDFIKGYKVEKHKRIIGNVISAVNSKVKKDFIASASAQAAADEQSASNTTPEQQAAEDAAEAQEGDVEVEEGGEEVGGVGD